MADPTMCALADITAAATRAVLWDGPPATYDNRADITDKGVLPVPPTPPFCAETARLARDAMARWSPSLHWLHHRKFRAAVHVVLLVRHRLELQHSNARDRRVTRQSAASAALPLLPPELWFFLCGWLLRRNWREECPSGCNCFAQRELKYCSAYSVRCPLCNKVTNRCIDW